MLEESRGWHRRTRPRRLRRVSSRWARRHPRRPQVRRLQLPPQLPPQGDRLGQRRTRTRDRNRSGRAVSVTAPAPAPAVLPESSWVPPRGATAQAAGSAVDVGREGGAGGHVEPE